MKLSRRTFLRAAGVSIALPWLDATAPWASGSPVAPPKRMLLLGRPLGLHAPYFFPEKAGTGYEPSRYLKPLEPLRADVTVFSGMSHRGYPGGHHTENALLTGVAPEGVRFGDLRNTISLDQEVASRVGAETRLPFLSLGNGGTGALSWNRKGVKIPLQDKATEVFKQLFIEGTPEEVAREVDRITNGRSILDGVRSQAKALSAGLGPTDRERLDLLLTSIREAEARLNQDQAWVLKPKPKIAATPYSDDYWDDLKMLARERQWFDLVHLALQTDSTRVIALWVWSHGRVNLPGVTIGHHDATHHGQDEAKIKQLALIEEEEMKLFAGLLSTLKATREGGSTLLDQTIVFYGSNIGNGSAHTCDNLPILLCGGGFRHAGHVAYDRKDNKPLSNLFVRMIRQMGLDLDRFGSSTGTLSEV